MKEDSVLKKITYILMNPYLESKSSETSVGMTLKILKKSLSKFDQIRPFRGPIIYLTEVRSLSRH